MHVGTIDDICIAWSETKAGIYCSGTDIENLACKNTPIHGWQLWTQCPETMEIKLYNKFINKNEIYFCSSDEMKARV